MRHNVQTPPRPERREYATEVKGSESERGGYAAAGANMIEQQPSGFGM